MLDSRTTSGEDSTVAFEATPLSKHLALLSSTWVLSYIRATSIGMDSRL